MMQVHRHRLEGRSVLSPVRLRPNAMDIKYDCLSLQKSSRGRWGSSLMTVIPSFKRHAAIGDNWNSSPLPESADGEQTTEDSPPQKGDFYARPLSRKRQQVKQESADGEQTMEDSPPQKHGLLQWLKNAVSRRTAQNKEMMNNLKRYGIAGVLSYGLLNTLYYLVTFLFVWFYVAPSPGGLGFGPATERFFKVFATVWAGSQVTKLIRLAGALSLAPVVDRGLNWFTTRFNFKSRATAFTCLVVACFGLAAFVFLVITTLWS